MSTRQETAPNYMHCCCHVLYSDLLYCLEELRNVRFFVPNAAAVIKWDSQVKDNCNKCIQTSPSSDGVTRQAPVHWDGKKTSGVVEELLKNATNKAYGANGETLGDV